MDRLSGVGVQAPAWPEGLLDVYASDRTRLVRTAFLICCSRAAAEDAVHDALLRVAARWDAVNDPRSYLYVAVVNAARDTARGARRFGALPAGNHAIHLDDDSLALRDALALLPERHRTAIVLRYFADWDDDEIASYMEVRAATVRSWVHRGVARLRKELEA